MRRIDAVRFEIAEHPLAENISAHARDHRDFSPQPGCHHRLVRALPSVDQMKRPAMQSLTQPGQPRHAGYQIHIGASNDAYSRSD